MAFNTYYVAWLNGQSVARGGRSEVERKAREIAETPLWKEYNPQTTLKITSGPQQRFCASIILK